MVLRFGTGRGDEDARGQAAFALVRHENQSLAPAFLADEQIFSGRPETAGDWRRSRCGMASDLCPSTASPSTSSLTPPVGTERRAQAHPRRQPVTAVYPHVTKTDRRIELNVDRRLRLGSPSG